MLEFHRSRKGPNPFNPPPASEAEMEVIRAMRPDEKFALVFRLNDDLRDFWREEIRTEFPDADEHEVHMRLAAKTLPRDLMLKAYHWDPEEHGAGLDPWVLEDQEPDCC